MSIILQELAFISCVVVALAWAQWRLSGPVAAFPGPRPVGPIFKIWFVVIWLVGGVLPLAALIYDGGMRGQAGTVWAIAPYVLMFALQIVCEMVMWKRLQSPVWVIVPCLFLPWRLYQCARGLDVADASFTVFALQAMFVLWVINIGVHFTNIPRALRWDFHPKDARFPALADARVIVGNPAGDRK
jgi:hypothetical protein